MHNGVHGTYCTPSSMYNGAHGTNCTSNSCTLSSLYIMEIMKLTVHLALLCNTYNHETNCTHSSIYIMEIMELTVQLANLRNA